MSTEGSVEGRFQLGIDQDIESARVLIEDLPWRNNPLRYRKAAEVILRRILAVDPENEFARTLLAKAETPPQETVWSTPRPLEPPAAPPQPRLVVQPPAPPPAPHPIEPAPPSPLALDLAFVVQPEVEKKPEETFKKREWGISVALIALAVVVVIEGALVWLGPHQRKPAVESPVVAQVTGVTSGDASSNTSGDTSSNASGDTSKDAAVSLPDQFMPSAPRVSLPPSLDLSTPALAPPRAPATVAAAASPAPPAPAAPPVVGKSSAPTPAPVQTGTLAVSSPTTVDIYLGDRFLGSAPITLDLPAGTQRIEYRHQEMRKVVAQVIKPDETTTAMVTFDVGVRINARPWAQVFIDGPTRQALGQTPLSDVQVPIGSLLVFENPNFPGKSYRVTGKETEIRVNFP